MKKIIITLVLLGLVLPVSVGAITKPPPTKLEMCTLRHDLTDIFGYEYAKGKTIASKEVEDVPAEYPDGVEIPWSSLSSTEQGLVVVDLESIKLLSLDGACDTVIDPFLKAEAKDKKITKTFHDGIKKGCAEGLLNTASAWLANDLTERFRAKATGVAAVSVLPDAAVACLYDLVETISDWFFVFLLVIAGVFILWGAYTFISAGGAPEKLKTARNILIWALVGIAVAFISKGLVKLVEQLIKA